MIKETHDLIEAIKELEEIKRLRELEIIIDSNKEIMKTFHKLTGIQKKMVNAKYYNKEDEYNNLLVTYNEVKDSISDIIFVDEYLELLDYAYNLLCDITNVIEKNINIDL